MNSALSAMEVVGPLRPVPVRNPLPVSVVIAVKNEERNLARCLASIRNAGQVFVIDSHSTDSTADVARRFGAQVVQFNYQGGWPKKRQWALDSLAFTEDWILLLDADEALSPALEEEIRKATADLHADGFYIPLRMYFLGRRLNHCGATFHKLALFRRGRGEFECRLSDQNSSMCDMEVHEHVIVSGATRALQNPIEHHNVDSLARYIEKHNQYSNWESAAVLRGNLDRLPPALFGNQAQRRRWLRKIFFRVPGSPVLLFFYRFLFRAGFLDGVPGLIYCAFQAVQLFHTKAKLFELSLAGEQL